MLLLRHLRRFTSLELSAREFAELNFGSREDSELFDHTLSVYEVEEGQALQAHAEHMASFMSKPPKKGAQALLLQGFPDLDTAESPGDTDFKFTKDQHRELNFLNDDEVLEVAAVVLEELESRLRLSAPDDIWSYVCARLEQDDAEWKALCTSKKHWNKWSRTPPRQRPLPNVETD